MNYLDLSTSLLLSLVSSSGTFHLLLLFPKLLFIFLSMKLSEVKDDDTDQSTCISGKFSLMRV